MKLGPEGWEQSMSEVDRIRLCFREYEDDEEEDDDEEEERAEE